MKTPTKKQVEKYRKQSIALLEQNGYTLKANKNSFMFELEKVNQYGITHTIRFFSSNMDFDLFSDFKSDFSFTKYNYACCDSSMVILENMIKHATYFTEEMFGDKRNEYLKTKKFVDAIFEK